MRGATEILQLRLRHQMAPSVVWVCVGEHTADPVMDHPCEVFIHVREPIESLDLRALHGLTVCLELYGVPSNRVLDYMHAVTSVAPSHVVALWLDDESGEKINRWWTPTTGWCDDWQGGIAA